MDNQKPVLQIQSEEIRHYFIIVFYTFIIFVVAPLGIFNSLKATLCLFGLLSLGLLFYFHYIQKPPTMNFYADGKIKYNNEIFNVEDYLGITTINNKDGAKYLLRRYNGFYPPNNYIILINKNKFKDDLYVFNIDIYFNDYAEYHETVQLKKQIAQITHLPLFTPCNEFILREKLTSWQEEENINHIISYKTTKLSQIEMIFYCCFAGFFGFSFFSNYHLLFTTTTTILSIIFCYLLFNKYRFYYTFMFNSMTTSQVKINNNVLSCNNQEIELNNIKQIKIKDIYSQKYYVYSRLNIELNNGKKIKLFVSTPQVRNPEKLRKFLSEKLPNKLIDEDKMP